MPFKIKLTLGKLFYSVMRDYHKICNEKWLVVCKVPASTLRSLLRVSWRDVAHCSELHSLSVTKYKAFQKSPTLFFSCTISVVTLGATAAVPSHISAQKEAVGFLGIIYASFMAVKYYVV